MRNLEPTLPSRLRSRSPEVHEHSWLELRATPPNRPFQRKHASLQPALPHLRDAPSLHCNLNLHPWSQLLLREPGRGPPLHCSRWQSHLQEGLKCHAQTRRGCGQLSTHRSARAAGPQLCCPWKWRSCCQRRRRGPSVLALQRSVSREYRGLAADPSSPPAPGVDFAVSDGHPPGSCPPQHRLCTGAVAAHSRWSALLPDVPLPLPTAACTGVSCDHQGRADETDATAAEAVGAGAAQVES